MHGAPFFLFGRDVAAGLEMQLHEVSIKSKICARQLKSAAREETARLAVKVDAMERELNKLSAVDSALRQTTSRLLESHRQLQLHIDHRTVPKEDWDRASQTIAALQAELTEGLEGKKDEISKLREALQVVGGMLCMVVCMHSCEYSLLLMRSALWCGNEAMCCGRTRCRD